MIRFSQPLLLLLFLALPFAAWLGWPARGAARKRETASLALRLLLLASLILGLAGLELAQDLTAAPRAVVFVVDRSASINSAGRDAQDAYLRQALETLGTDDQAAIVVFGEQALVERPMTGRRDFTPLTSIVGANGSSLDKAIILGLTLYPAGSARRMVLLTDGQAAGAEGAGAEGAGAARAAVRLAASLGVEVTAADIPALLQNQGGEIILKDLSLPASLRQGDQFDLTLTIESSQPITQPLPVRIAANGSLAADTLLDLGDGEQLDGIWRYQAVITQTASQSGFVQYQAQIEPAGQNGSGLAASQAGDTLYQNNELGAYTQVAGIPQILLVIPTPGETLPGGDPRPDESSLLLQALRGAGQASPGFSVQTVTPIRMPGEPERLAQYAAVVLVDVPADQLSDGQMLGLNNYVQTGGGLLAVGGPTSFGVGGYSGTNLEAALPVEMDIKDEKRRPSLAMVFIIDHSGSMGDLSGGKTKLEIAKEAVIRSLRLLQPQDRVGVIVFDDTAAWAAEIAPLENANRLVSLVGRIEIGGGTDILAGVQAMAKVLPSDPAKTKHVILLTDGGADPSGIAQLITQLNQDYGITLSTIGVGRDAAPFLPGLAEAGNGRYHFAADPSQIPAIFTQETALAARSYIVEGDIQPELVDTRLAETLGLRSPDGAVQVPGLLGYVAATARPASTVVLQAPPVYPDAASRDPILAVWNYGLGRAAAFTSDATARWAVDWVFDPARPGLLRAGYVQFWQGLVRHLMGDASPGQAGIRVEQRYAPGDLAAGGLSAEITVDTATTGVLLNGYIVQAVVAGPDGESQTVSLAQTGPGLYSGRFTPGSQGVYLVTVSGAPPVSGNPAASGSPAAGQPGFQSSTGWVLSYSPEFASLKSKDDRQRILLTLAAGGFGGQPFIGPEQVFNYQRAAGGETAARPAWPWLLGLAALLLPLDIAVRRLVLSWSDVRRAMAAVWQKITSRLRPAKITATGTPRSSQMQTLLGVKEPLRNGLEGDILPSPAGGKTGWTQPRNEGSTGDEGAITPALHPDSQQLPHPNPLPKGEGDILPSPSGGKTSWTQPRDEGSLRDEGTSVNALLKSKRQRRDGERRDE